jgi:hypothetical protein
MTDAQRPLVVDNANAHRFEINIDGATAFMNYRIHDNAIEYLHSETPPELRGRGYAGAIARAALENDKAIGRKVIPTCPFVRTYLARHPKYASLVLRK